MTGKKLIAHEELEFAHPINPRSLVENRAGAAAQMFDLDAIVNDLEQELDDAVSSVRDDVTVLWGADELLLDDGADPLNADDIHRIGENVMVIDLDTLFGAHVHLANHRVN